LRPRLTRGLPFSRRTRMLTPCYRCIIYTFTSAAQYSLEDHFHRGTMSTGCFASRSIPLMSALLARGDGLRMNSWRTFLEIRLKARFPEIARLPHGPGPEWPRRRHEGAGRGRTQSSIAPVQSPNPVSSRGVQTFVCDRRAFGTLHIYPTVLQGVWTGP
jgi:hypothetical protein